MKRFLILAIIVGLAASLGIVASGKASKTRATYNPTWTGDLTSEVICVRTDGDPKNDRGIMRLVRAYTNPSDDAPNGLAPIWKNDQQPVATNHERCFNSDSIQGGFHEVGWQPSP